jgi:hypothetical protein
MEDPYPLMNPYQGLAIDRSELSLSAGGTIHFSLNAGPLHANKDYVILGSATHVLPGTPIPGSAVELPLVWDSFTDLMIRLLHTPVFHNFLGVLDTGGSADAMLQTGPITPDAVGITLYFSSALYLNFEWASNPVSLTLVP